MQGTLFNFIIFAGVFLLEFARANNTCDITQVNTCAMSILQSGVLQRFQNINETEIDKACDEVTLTLNCITTAGSTCSATTLQDVQPVITAIEASDTAFCNEGECSH
ncbi:hypothetical protein V1264_003489 [Littorina saxatilis]|uniref:Uncharacterized protein n=1 Tax=Littorina saxatilis TaxID=31220 RepID=A0AAN9B536_9CAEN